jgi:hypothetical protein
MFSFRSAPLRRSETAIPHVQHWKRDGRRPMGQSIQSIILIAASTKMKSKESKKAKRSIALAKGSHLEAIRVDWEREVDRSSKADFKSVKPRSHNSLKIEEG